MSIQQLDITIKYLNLNNKKLTKSIFNQIEDESCFNSKMDFIGSRYFGYIKEKNKKFLIWEIDGKLRRTDLSVYISLKYIDEKRIYRSSQNNDNLRWFLNKCNIDYDEEDYQYGDKIEMSDTSIDEYNSLYAKVKDFISELMERHQLYI